MTEIEKQTLREMVENKGLAEVVKTLAVISSEEGRKVATVPGTKALFLYFKNAQEELVAASIHLDLNRQFFLRG